MALLSLILLLSLGLLWLIAVAAYAQSLMSPPRMTDGKAAYRLGRLSPADLGFAFDLVTFTGPDGVKFVAWWIPAEGASRTAVLLHGYADAKVGALAWAPQLRGLDGGYNLLLPDLRAHGESGGQRTTIGMLEASDLAAVLTELRAQRPGQTRQILLFGASLGAAVASRFLADDQYVEASAGVTGVILDSPAATFNHGALGHARLLDLPGKLLVPAALWLARRLIGVDFNDAAALPNLPNLRVPALLILPKQDAYVFPEDRLLFAQAFAAHQAKHPSALLWEPDCPHLLASSVEPEAYQSALDRFAGPGSR